MFEIVRNKKRNLFFTAGSWWQTPTGTRDTNSRYKKTSMYFIILKKTTKTQSMHTLNTPLLLGSASTCIAYEI